MKLHPVPKRILLRMEPYGDKMAYHAKRAKEGHQKAKEHIQSQRVLLLPVVAVKGHGKAKADDRGGQLEGPKCVRKVTTHFQTQK